MKIYVLVIVCLWTILGLLTTIDEATKPPLVKNQILIRPARWELCRWVWIYSTKLYEMMINHALQNPQSQISHQ